MGIKEPIYNAALDYLGKITALFIGEVFNKVVDLERWGQNIPMLPAVEYGEKGFGLGCDQCVNRSLPSVIWNFTTETDGRSSADDFVIYQGYALPNTLRSSIDLFLPTSSILERESFFINLMGSVRVSRVVLSPLKTTFTDPALLRYCLTVAFAVAEKQKNLGECIGRSNLFLKITYGRAARTIENQKPPFFGDFKAYFFDMTSIVLEHNWPISLRTYVKAIDEHHFFAADDKKVSRTNAFIDSSFDDYYAGDVFSRLSPILTRCSGQTIFSNFAKHLPPLD